MIYHKIWNYNDLITNYITEKTRNGYELNTAQDELKDFLEYITKHTKIKTSNYDEIIAEYIEGYGSKTKSWSICDEDFKIISIVTKTDSGLLVPTYDLEYKKEEKDELLQFIQIYLSNNIKIREIDKSIELTKPSIEFGEKAAASLLLNYWHKLIKNYINNRKWPSQCTDIKQFLLDVDLSKAIKLGALREELLNFYAVIAERISYVSQNDASFKMTNFEKEVLAKSNFDLVMQGYRYYQNACIDKNMQRGEIVSIERKTNKLQITKDIFNDLRNSFSLEEPQILKLVKHINDNENNK